MINAKGETIYTNAEIAYELGLSPATVNACAKRLYGGCVPHWTLLQARRIAEYVRSISVEEDAKRLAILHETIAEVMQGVTLSDDEDMRKRVDKDINLVKYSREVAK